MANGPFRVALSELTTMMSTGLESPAEKDQLIVLVEFATLSKSSACDVRRRQKTHQNEVGDGPRMVIVPANNQELLPLPYTPQQERHTEGGREYGESSGEGSEAHRERVKRGGRESEQREGYSSELVGKQQT
jgi:hypothetical protein